MMCRVSGSGTIDKNVRKYYYITMQGDFLISKLTSKSQTVIPKAVRERLRLKPGDLIRYRLRGQRIEIEKMQEEAVEDPFAAFEEWASQADEKAFKDL